MCNVSISLRMIVVFFLTGAQSRRWSHWVWLCEHKQLSEPAEYCCSGATQWRSKFSLISLVYIEKYIFLSINDLAVCCSLVIQFSCFILLYFQKQCKFDCFYHDCTFWTCLSADVNSSIMFVVRNLYGSLWSEMAKRFRWAWLHSGGPAGVCLGECTKRHKNCHSVLCRQQKQFVSLVVIRITVNITVLFFFSSRCNIVPVQQ